MSKIETKQITLVSENGLVEKTLSIDNSGVVRIDGIEQAGIVSGDFTPTVFGTTTAGTCTYIDRFGSYTKIGKRVFIDVYLSWSGHTGTGTIRIAGLPFFARSTYPRSVGSIQSYGVSTSANSFVAANTRLGDNTIQLLSQTLNGDWAEFAMDSAGTLAISMSYLTD